MVNVMENVWEKNNGIEFSKKLCKVGVAAKDQEAY